MLSVEVYHKGSPETVTVQGDIIASRLYTNIDTDEIRLLASDTFLGMKGLTSTERRYWGRVHTRTDLGNFPVYREGRKR